MFSVQQRLQTKFTPTCPGPVNADAYARLHTTTKTYSNDCNKHPQPFWFRLSAGSGPSLTTILLRPPTIQRPSSDVVVALQIHILHNAPNNPTSYTLPLSLFLFVFVLFASFVIVRLRARRALHRGAGLLLHAASSISTSPPFRFFSPPFVVLYVASHACIAPLWASSAAHSPSAGH